MIEVKKVVISFGTCGIYIPADYITKDNKLNTIDFYKDDCIGLIASVDLNKFRFKFTDSNKYANYYYLVKK